MTGIFSIFTRLRRRRPKAAYTDERPPPDATAGNPAHDTSATFEPGLQDQYTVTTQAWQTERADAAPEAPEPEAAASPAHATEAPAAAIIPETEHPAVENTVDAASVASLADGPSDLNLGIEQARLAEERGDWPAAAEHWRRLALACPDVPEAGYGHAVALQRLGFSAKAEAVLADLAARFPEYTPALHDLARHAENRGDFPAAEGWWQAFHKADTSSWWSYSALANAMRQQGRLAEAETVLRNALTRFPDQPSLLADEARLAESGADWPEALRRWDDLIVRFPATWIGYAGKIAALARTGGQAAADAALLEYAARLPDDAGALHDRARLAERQQDWPTAEAAWRGFLRQDDRMEWAHQGLIQALVRQDRLAEADTVLAAALARFPGQTGLVIEAARLSELRDQPQEAAAHWREVERLLPAASIGPIGVATILARQGDSAGAEAVMAAALDRLPDDLALHEAHADIALAADDPREALTRLQAARRRFPAELRLADRIDTVETRLAAMAEDPSLADPEAEAASDEIRGLLLDFESLGGSGGQGGAFAAFQHAHGAEPLGLLRWAEALPDELSEALEADLAGFGTAAQTDMAVPTGAIPAHYRITDDRFGIAMPSFIDAADTPPNDARRLIEQRLSMLRGKLLDDLQAGARIFVYVHGLRAQTGPELDRLHAACRRNGDATLLFLRHADAHHPGGTVAFDRPGLLIGSFGERADGGAPATAELLAICQRAHALWRGRRVEHHPATGMTAAAAPVTAGS